MKRIFTICLLFVFTTNIQVIGQWQPLNSGTSENLVDGCFLNDSTCIVISANGQVLRSTDYGLNWIQTATLSGTFTSVCAAENNVLYAGGDHIYQSNNGGVNWVLKSTLAYTVKDLMFFEAGHGFYLAPHYAHCSTGGFYGILDDFQVYETNDYGASWLFKFGNIHSYSEFLKADSSTAYITGVNQMFIYHCATLPSQSYSQRTTDKGQNWFLTNYPDGIYGFYAYISKDSGYYFYQYDQDPVRRTFDGGQSEVVVNAQLPQEYIRQCLFLNDIDGFILADNNIYVSRSNGMKWKTDFAISTKINYLIKTKNNLVLGIGNNGFIVRNQFIPSTHPEPVYRINTDSTKMFFGTVPVNLKTAHSFKIKNIGNVPINLTLNSSSDFKISLSDTAFSTNMDVSLNANSDTAIHILFSPSNSQHYQDTLLITADSIDPYRIPLSGNAVIALSGTIANDTLICHDTIRIIDKVVINSNAKLTICAGTKILLIGDASIEVKGSILALGEPTNPIDFIPLNQYVTWSGISIDPDNDSALSVFNYCRFTAPAQPYLIDFFNGNLTLNHCTISPPHIAGGIHIIKALPTSKPGFRLTDCDISNVHAAVLGVGENLYIANSNIHHNAWGLNIGGMKTDSILNNHVHDNTVTGIIALGACVIRNCIINNNSLGGIEIDGGYNVLVENNVIYNNVYQGGLLCKVQYGATIRQNLIYNNSTSIDGGGLALYLSSIVNFVYLVNNTICNNKSANGGARNNVYISAQDKAYLKIFNNIFWDTHSASDGFYISNKTNAQIENNCINDANIGSYGSLNIHSDPRFLKPSNLIGAATGAISCDWSLKNISYCINKASLEKAPGLPATDIAGMPRVYDSLLDMGAYEFQGKFVNTDTIPAESGGVIVFPNPVRYELSVKVNSTDPVELRIFDFTSKGVLFTTFSESVIINTENFLNGMYFYELRGADGLIATGKFVKQ